MFSALAALAASPQSPIPRAAQLGGPARRVLLGSRHDPRDLRGIAVDGRAVPSAHARRRRDRQDRVHRKGGRRRGHRELAATRLDPRLRRREGTARGAPEGQREERPKDSARSARRHSTRSARRNSASGYVPSKEAVILWTTFAASDYASDRSCVNGISTGPHRHPHDARFRKGPIGRPRRPVRHLSRAAFDPRRAGVPDAVPQQRGGQLHQRREPEHRRRHLRWPHPRPSRATTPITRATSHESATCPARRYCSRTCCFSRSTETIAVRRAAPLVE